MKKYHYLVFAGTFDHFHLGHQKLLDLAFSLSQKVAIGITTKKLYQDKFLSQTIESFLVRKKAVEDYLKNKKWLRRAVFFPLSDIYGPAKTDKSFEAILVSKKSFRNSVKVNQVRKVRNLPELKIIIAPNILSDDGKIITSERIRGGEIDREGNSYQLSVGIGHCPVRTSEENKLILPEYLRPELRRPIGKVIAGEENKLEKTAKKALQYINIMKSTVVISVGDVITNSLLKIGFEPEIKIVDFRVRRKPIINPKSKILNPKQILNYKSKIINSKQNIFEFRNSNLFGALNLGFRILNKPGTVSAEAINASKSALSNYFKTGTKQLIIIDGEEDLTALPAILLSPLGSVVLYGQMDLGVVVVSVTEEKKREVKEILRKFV
jgi:uncharacterized protein (UPF0218 family)/phosphopantetheine adenylyltransferase